MSRTRGGRLAWRWIWPPLIGVATFTQMFLSRRVDVRGAMGFARQLFGMNVAFSLGFTALGVMLAATTGLDMNLYAPICVGIAYAANGVLVGRELVGIGGWLIAAALAAAFMPTDVGLVWMAGAGGGGLLVTGLLLRRQNRRS